MTATEQRFPANGVTRVNIEAERTNLSLRWVATDEIRITGDAVEIERQDDEIWIGKGGGSGARDFFSDSRMEIGDEGVAFRLGDLGEFIAGGKEGVSFRLKDVGEFSAGPEGVNIIGAGEEIHIGSDSPRRRKTKVSREKTSRAAKASRDQMIEIELPVSLATLSIELRHGDLALEDAHGSIDLRLDDGDLTVHGGEAAISAKAGSGQVLIEDVTGNLAIEDGSGDIRIESVTGNVALTSGSGDLTLVSVDGKSAIMTGSGDIRVAGGSANLAIKTGSGDVSVRERADTKLAIVTGSGDVSVTGGSTSALSIHTGSGDIRCRTALGSNDHEIRAGAGDISLEVPRNLSARFKVSTSRGRIDSEIPLVTVGQRGPRSLLGRRLVGSIGEGPERADITLRTAQGDVRLQWTDAIRMDTGPASQRATATGSTQSPTGPAPSRTPIVPASPPTGDEMPKPGDTVDDEEERRGVLQALAADTISVEEAGRLLDAISKRSKG